MLNIKVYLNKNAIESDIVTIDIASDLISFKDLRLPLSGIVDQRCFVYGHDDLVITNGNILSKFAINVIGFDTKQVVGPTSFYVTDNISVEVYISNDTLYSDTFNTFLNDCCGTIYLINTVDMNSFTPQKFTSNGIGQSGKEIIFALYSTSKYNTEEVTIIRNNNLEMNTITDYNEIANILNKYSDTNHYCKTALSLGEDFIKASVVLYTSTIEQGNNVFYLKNNVHAHYNRSSIYIYGI